MGLFRELLKWSEEIEKDKERKIKEELEKQMEARELEDWQKDLVRKGKYDPWNFEEKGDLEDDDYYYEDGD